MMKPYQKILISTGVAVVASSYFLYFPIIPFREFRPYFLPICFWIGSGIIPVVLGILVAGHQTTHSNILGAWNFVSSVSSIVFYLCFMIAIEILVFHPWRLAVLPDGGTYNRYSLNALYFSPFAFFVVVLWFAGFGGRLVYHFANNNRLKKQ